MKATSTSAATPPASAHCGNQKKPRERPVFASSAGSSRAHAVRSKPSGASTGAAVSTIVITRRSC